MMAVIKRTQSFLILYCLAAAGALYGISAFSKTTSLLWVNGHHSVAADLFFKYFTHLGDGLFYIALIIFLFFYRRPLALQALVAYALTSLVVQVMKNFIFDDALRPRGVINNDALIHFVQGVEVYFLSSFPSGHTASAFSIALLMSWLFPKKGWVLLFFIYALLVAYSRMYLAEHFLMDVFAGSLIGVGFTLAVIAVFEWNKKRRQSMVK